MKRSKRKSVDLDEDTYNLLKEISDISKVPIKFLVRDSVEKIYSEKRVYTKKLKRGVDK